MTARRRALVGALAALTALALGGCRGPVELPAPGALAQLARPTLAGPAFDPGALAGKVVVVNFWSPG